MAHSRPEAAIGCHVARASSLRAQASDIASSSSTSNKKSLGRTITLHKNRSLSPKVRKPGQQSPKLLENLLEQVAYFACSPDLASDCPLSPPESQEGFWQKSSSTVCQHSHAMGSVSSLL